MTSQKAHNALRWLIQRQGFRNGDQIIAAWAVSGKEIPKPLATFDLDKLDDYSKIEDLQTVDYANMESDGNTIDMGQSYARKLNRYMAGYRANIPPTDTISIMAIDSATSGRISITYYREYLPPEYLDQITRWHIEFAWFQHVSKEVPRTEGKPKTIVAWAPCAPSPFTIINSVYGHLLNKSNESFKKNFFERLMPSIIEGAPIPRDFVVSAFNQARSPAGKEEWEWEKCLGVACSLYRGFHIRHPQVSNRKEFTMSLDTSNTSRDYLYGRLLAIAEQIEARALYIADINRPTATMRLMQRFSDRPFSTWQIIYNQLNPYMLQLKNSSPGFLTAMRKEVDEVMDLFDANDYKLEKNLNGEFLLGFHAERLFLRAKNRAHSQDATESKEE